MPQRPAEDAAGGTRPPRVWTVLVACLVVFLGVAALGLLAVVVSLGRSAGDGALEPGAFQPGLPELLALAAGTAAWILLVATVAARLSPEPARLRLGLVPPVPGGAATWAVAIAGGLATSQAVDLAFTLSGLGRGETLDALLGVLGGARGPGLVAALLVVAGATGFAEELFFRGYAQRRLAARGGPAAGVAAAAALFALAHFDPQHSAFAFVFGLYAGAVAWWTASTWTAVAVHVANNAVAVLLVASGLDDPLLAGPAPGLLAGLVVLVAVAVGCLAWLARRAPRRSPRAPALDVPPPPRGGCAP